MRRILAPVVAVLAVSVPHAGSPPQREAVRAEEIRPDAPEGWDLFQSPDGRFSILLPVHRVTSEAEDGGVTVHVVQARTADDCQYAVLWSDENGPDAVSALGELLSSIAAGRGVGRERNLVAGWDARAFPVTPARCADVPRWTCAPTPTAARVQLYAIAPAPCCAPPRAGSTRCSPSPSPSAARSSVRSAWSETSAHRGSRWRKRVGVEPTPDG